MHSANPARAESPVRLQQERFSSLVMRGEYGKAADQLGLARTDLCLAQIILNWAFLQSAQLL